MRVRAQLKRYYGKLSGPVDPMLDRGDNHGATREDPSTPIEIVTTPIVDSTTDLGISMPIVQKPVTLASTTPKLEVSIPVTSEQTPLKTPVDSVDENAVEGGAPNQFVKDSSLAPADEDKKSVDSTISDRAEDATVEASVEDGGGEADAEINPQDVAASGELPAEEATSSIPEEILIQVGGEQMALTTMVESLLFVAERPTEPLQFAKVLDLSVEQVEAALSRLTWLYQSEARGIRVQERNGRYVLVSMPAAANAIETFLNLDLSMKLSGPALEALAIVAYRQPVTRQQIEAVRGVDCGHVLRVLLQHDLIEEVGRLETAGRPILYGVTDLFMQHFGLTNLGELPKLEITEADLLWATTEIAGDEDDEVAGGIIEDGTTEDSDVENDDGESKEEILRNQP